MHFFENKTLILTYIEILHILRMATNRHFEELSENKIRYVLTLRCIDVEDYLLKTHGKYVLRDSSKDRRDSKLQKLIINNFIN